VCLCATHSVTHLFSTLQLLRSDTEQAIDFIAHPQFIERFTHLFTVAVLSHIPGSLSRGFSTSFLSSGNFCFLALRVTNPLICTMGAKSHMKPKAMIINRGEKKMSLEEPH
jgi:hypothetical protein